MRALAQRIQHLNAEISDHDKAMILLLRQAAPQLLAERGIAHVTAATFYLAWSHPGRCRNEAAYARLAGAAPIPRHPVKPRTGTDSTTAATGDSTMPSTSWP